jgi:GDPmannose 4,6-dehydratase
MAMWLMLHHDVADDYVIGTGEAHSVREFLQQAFAYVGMDWQEYVTIDPRYFRPLEVEHLRADASKARKQLGWEPRVTFSELVRIMVDADLETMGIIAPGEGKRILREKFPDWHQWDGAVTRMLQQEASLFE